MNNFIPVNFRGLEMFNSFGLHRIRNNEIAKSQRDRKSLTALVNICMDSIFRRFGGMYLDRITDTNPIPEYDNKSNCNVGNIRRSIRLYWTLFGGNHTFFRGQEIANSRKPILSIEYDLQNSAIFTPELEQEATQSGQGLGFKRRYLRISVKNIGGSVAEDCKAQLRIVSATPNAVLPSAEPKKLCWENGEEKQDIAIGDNDILNIVLSDSRLRGGMNGIFALLGTWKTLEHWWPISAAPMQDGMGIGQFMTEIEIRSRTGEIIKTTFRITVTENWQEIRMERIS